ncbi:MAG: hypothetical protein LIO91_03545 [Bacteroidales bacterium]|nr:hypothetical protein [Bacteroidales bacterium]
MTYYHSPYTPTYRVSDPMLASDLDIYDYYREDEINDYELGRRDDQAQNRSKTERL